MLDPRAASSGMVGRYALYGELASGGMAVVHYGRLLGPVGFARTVAIKRLHGQYAKDPEFVAMFLDEARLAARIHHPNVVQTVDVVVSGSDISLVMEYIHGESLARVLQRAHGPAMPLPVVCAVLCGVLHGLHAAHEATSDRGDPLGIVHRDVSPQNVLVGADGVARVLDFGVAKAVDRTYATQQGQIKGKLAYMAPEQLLGKTVDRRSDIFAAGVVLWEMLTSRRLFADQGGNGPGVIQAVLHRIIESPASLSPDVPSSIADICLRALQRDPDARFATAREMALSLEACLTMSSPTQLATWLDGLLGATLTERAALVASIESDSGARQRLARSDDESFESSPPTSTSSISVEGVDESATEVDARSPGRKPRRGWITVAGGALAFPSVFVLGMAIRRPAPVAATELAVHAPPAGATVSNDVPVPAPTPSPVLSAVVTADSSPSAPVATVNAGKQGGQGRSQRPSSTGLLTQRNARGVPTTPSSPCAVRSYVDDSGIMHFDKDCK